MRQIPLNAKCKKIFLYYFKGTLLSPLELKCSKLAGINIVPQSVSQRQTE